MKVRQARLARVALVVLALSGKAGAFSADAFQQCANWLGELSGVPRPLPESSGSEVEARVVSKDGKIQPAVIGLLTTTDGTVGPLLTLSEIPVFVSRHAADLALSDPKKVPWDRLSDSEKTELVELSGQALAASYAPKVDDKIDFDVGPTTYPDPKKAAIHHFGKARQIPGLQVRPVVDIEVPPGRELFIFGKTYGPGKHQVSLAGVATAVEWGRASDMLKFELVEMHFRTDGVQDITPGESALSVRHLLAGRGYAFGKQHQHSVTADPPSPAVFGPNSQIITTAVSTKLVADANLLAELIVVRDLGRSVDFRNDGPIIASLPMRAHDMSTVVRFFDGFSRGSPQALQFDAEMKPFSVGVRGPAKFGGKGWSLEFRMLFPETLGPEGQKITVAMIDAAKFKMQALSGKAPGGLGEDAATLERWFASRGRPKNLNDLQSRFQEGWPNNESWALTQAMTSAVAKAQGPTAKKHIAEVEKDGKSMQLTWLVHNWSQSHYVHLSADAKVNRQRQQRIEDAQVAALKALEKVPFDKSDDSRKAVAKIMSDFVDASGLQALAMESLGQH